MIDTAKLLKRQAPPVGKLVPAKKPNPTKTNTAPNNGGCVSLRK